MTSLSTTFMIVLSICVFANMLNFTAAQAATALLSGDRVCSKLRDMFIANGCLTQATLKCRLIVFRLSQGILTKEPRCDFLPCEDYGQPANQTCVSKCVGTVISGGLCAAGQTCCVESGTPATPKPPGKCPYTCRSSSSCKQSAPGFTCPYPYDVCCIKAKDPFDDFDYFPTKKPCPYTCTNLINCNDIDYSSTCGWGVDVCCRQKGSIFFYDSSFNDDWFDDSDLKLDGLDSYGNLKGVGDYGLTKPTQLQPICQYTCYSADGCAEVDTTSTCPYSGQVCCKTIVTAPTQAPTHPPQKTLFKPPQPTPTLLHAASFTLPHILVNPCHYTCRPLQGCAEVDVGAACKSGQVCCKQEVVITKVIETTTQSGSGTECPYSCKLPLLCSEQDTNFSCDGRKVCCKKGKLSATTS